MQEVVDVPRLVADDEVEVLALHQLVEDHEVVDQDLVHAPDGVERVQVVLARLLLDVPRLAGEVPRRGVDVLAVGGQHPRHRVLGEPLDLEVGVQPAQPTGHRHVAAGVPEADGGGDVEGPPPASYGARAGPSWGDRREALGEGTDLVVDQHGVAQERAVAGPLDHDQAAPGQLREPLAVGESAHLVLRPVQHRDRHGELRAQRLDVAADRAVAPEPPGRHVDEGLRGHLPTPRHGVLELLGRVRLVEHPSEEEVQEVVVATAEPVVLVVLLPPDGAGQRLVPRHVVAVRVGHEEKPHDGAIAKRPSTRSGWSAATCTDQAAPQERETRTARSTPAASITATVSAAYSSLVYAAAPAAARIAPLPRPSKVTTRKRRAR